MAGMPGLFADAEWRRLPASQVADFGAAFRTAYQLFQQQILRVKVVHPRGDQALRQDRDADRQELGRLMRRVMDCAYRTARTPPVSRSAAMPPSLYYWCELLQRVCPYLTDWEALTGGLAACAYGVCTLYNDDRPVDLTLLDRLYRDQIADTTWWIMSQAGGGRSVHAWAEYERTGGGFKDAFLQEMRRLNREGILLARKNFKPTGLHGGGNKGSRKSPWSYRLGAPEWHQMIDRSQPLFGF